MRSITSNGMSKTKKNIAIIDYGVGNLHSLIKAFKHFGQNAFITEEANDIKSADAIVLPGVGAFKSGMEGLMIRSLVNAIKDFSKTGKPILGICLGAQLLMSEGYEFGKFKGLDIIPGKVVIFEKIQEKIPHIGWNEIMPPLKKSWKGSILQSTKDRSNVYFVHSYIFKPSKQKNIFAYTQYGNTRFCSAIKMDNVYGCQFHPEKSGDVGLKIIENFIKLA